MKAQDDSDSNYSGVFIFKDLKSIEDTNNAITIIILITAIIFLAVSTVLHFSYHHESQNLYVNLEIKLKKYRKVIIHKLHLLLQKTKLVNCLVLLIT